MTDFGGSGHGGTVAECELNIPIKITSGSATLTSSDLNELGCSASTTKHLNERIESNDSGFSSRSSQSAGSSVAENLKPSKSTTTNTQEKPTNKSKIRKKESPMTQKRHRRSSSSRHFVRSLIAAMTNGFSNCSRKKNQNNGTQNGPDHRRHSDSEEDSAQDSFGNNFKSNMKIRNISRDGAGFVIGSEATSTGYVSDSVDGYDKCKGLESEHGRSDQDHSDRCDHHDRNSDHDRSVGVSNPESFCSINSRDNISKQVLMSEKNDYSKCNLLETSVTAAISAKLNLNYIDKEENDGAKEHETQIEKSNKTETKYDGNNVAEKPTEYVYVAEDDTEDDSCESGNESEHDEEEPTGSQTRSQTGNTNSNSDSDISDYETNDSSSSYLDLETTQDIKNSKLDVIMEEYDEEVMSPDDFGAEYPPEINNPTPKESGQNESSQKLKKKPTIKRKKSVKTSGERTSSSGLRRRNSKAEEDLKNGMKAKLTSLRNDLKAKEEDAISRTNSLKDMILQFETAVAALEIGEGQISDSDSDSESNSPQLGVKAIAQKIQEQNAHANEFECAQMPPSQILKLKQALDLEDEKLSKPVPISRRSESKVKLIAKQLAEAEKRRLQMEKLARSQMMKSPKDIKKAASTSFINELLEMARAESEDKLNEISKKEEPHDFKQSLLAARKKITHREQQATTTTNQNTEKKSDQPKSKPSRIESRTKSVTSVSSVENVGVPEEIDPFVKEVLTSKTVPEPVKQKIRIECWSLFNDPRTPKGVKQCILATMLSKVQNE
jgi:hypothetical protein